MKNNDENEFLLANIPSEKPYYVSKKGEIKGIFNRVLKTSVSKENRSSKIVYKGTDGKRHQIGFRKLIWNTFFPNDLSLESDMIFLKDKTIPFPLQPDNLYKLSRTEVALRIGKVNRLIKERELLFKALEKQKTITKEEMYNLLNLKEKEKGRVILNNLITRLKYDGSLERVGPATYALKKSK